MNAPIRLPEIDDIVEALRPLASQVETKEAHWITTPDGEHANEHGGNDWCEECAEKEIEGLRAKDADNADDYRLDGGWASEHDSPPHCAGCGVRLQANLTAAGGIYELDHFREHAPEPGNAGHAYEVSEMLDAFRCVDPEHEEAAREAIAIGRKLAEAMPAPPRP